MKIALLKRLVFGKFQACKRFDLVSDAVQSAGSKSIGTVSRRSLRIWGRDDWLSPPSSPFGGSSRSSLPAIVIQGLLECRLALNISLAAVGLPVSVFAQESITLSWDDNSSNEDGFRIMRSQVGRPYKPLAEVGPNVTSFEVIEGFDPNQYSSYKVKAFNKYGESGYTNEVYYNPFSGFYQIQINPDIGLFALLVADNRQSVFSGAFEGSDSFIVERAFELGVDGSFDFSVPGVGEFRGSISQGSLIGALRVSSLFSVVGPSVLETAGVSLPLSGTLKPGTVDTQSIAGNYHFDESGGLESRVSVIVGAGGKGFASTQNALFQTSRFIDFPVGLIKSEIHAFVEDQIETALFLEESFSKGKDPFLPEEALVDSGSPQNEDLPPLSSDSVIVNASIRIELDAKSKAIAGFTIVGPGQKALLIRGVGPSLSSLGVPNPSADVDIGLYQGLESEPRIGNQSWWENGDTTFIRSLEQEVGAFRLLRGSKDAALYVSLPQGTYTVHAQNRSDADGAALIELYDLDDYTGSGSPSSSMVNFSVRCASESRSKPLILGFALIGNQPRGVVLRAVGPELEDLGVGNVLDDPQFKVQRAFRTPSVIFSADDWGEESLIDRLLINRVGDLSSVLYPGSKSAAKVAWLEPNDVYTVVVKGSGSDTGDVLIELFDVR